MQQYYGQFDATQERFTRSELISLSIGLLVITAFVYLVTASFLHQDRCANRFGKDWKDNGSVCVNETEAAIRMYK